MKTQAQPGRAPQTGNQKRHDEGDRAGQVRAQDFLTGQESKSASGHKKESRDPTSKRHADPEEDGAEDRKDTRPEQNPRSAT
jgi:hypothetical protein